MGQTIKSISDIFWDWADNLESYREQTQALLNFIELHGDHIKFREYMVGLSAESDHDDSE